MDPVAVVTGAGTGIGRAIARRLDAEGYAVIGVGRRPDPLTETGEGRRAYESVAADVATAEGRSAVVRAVAERPVRYLVHNAGRLEPVGDLCTIDPEEWRTIFAVNVDAPLFLTRALLPRLYEGARVLHVSSGAAHRPVRGWGSYCATKATLHMIYRLLADELHDRGIAVGSVRPGVVDTPMQALIRAQPEARFPGVERFRRLKRDGELVTPEAVAAFVWRLLHDTDADAFCRDEWDIREHAALLD